MKTKHRKSPATNNKNTSVLAMLGKIPVPEDEFKLQIKSFRNLHYNSLQTSSLMILWKHK